MDFFGTSEQISMGPHCKIKKLKYIKRMNGNYNKQKILFIQKKKEIKDNMSLIHLYIFIYTSFISTSTSNRNNNLNLKQTKEVPDGTS